MGSGKNKVDYKSKLKGTRKNGGNYIILDFWTLKNHTNLLTGAN